MESIAFLTTSVLGFLTLLFAILRTTGSLRREMLGYHAELKSELKDEVGGLRKELHDTRAELKSEALGSRNELKGEIRRLETRVERGFKEIRSDHRDLRGRIDRITDSLALRGLIPADQS